LLTYENAPRYKVIRTDARKPDLTSAEAVVPPGEAVVTTVATAQDGIGRVLRVPYGPRPQVEEVALPFKGMAYVGAAPRLPGALLYLTGWTRAYRIYAYDPETKRVNDTRLQAFGPSDDPTNIETVEVKARSAEEPWCRCPLFT